MESIVNSAALRRVSTLLIIAHFVYERANLADFHLNVIIIPQHHPRLPEISNSSRRTGQQDTSCL